MDLQTLLPNKADFEKLSDEELRAIIAGTRSNRLNPVTPERVAKKTAKVKAKKAEKAGDDLAALLSSLSPEQLQLIVSQLSK